MFLGKSARKESQQLLTNTCQIIHISHWHRRRFACSPQFTLTLARMSIIINHFSILNLYLFFLYKKITEKFVENAYVDLLNGLGNVTINLLRIIVIVVKLQVQPHFAAKLYTAFV